MPAMEWLAEYSVKVKEIDDQHKQLIAMINELHQAFVKYKGLDVQKSILDKIVEYTATHFATEEKYMQKFNYPGYEEHKAEHEKFIAKALDLQKRAGDGGFVFSLEIINFLKDLLANHLLTVDMKYVDFFQKQGLK